MPVTSEVIVYVVYFPYLIYIIESYFVTVTTPVLLLHVIMQRGPPSKFEMSNIRNHQLRNRYRYSLESSLGSEYASRWFLISIFYFISILFCDYLFIYISLFYIGSKCDECMTRVPYATLIATIMCILGVGVFCGTIYRGTTLTGLMMVEVFNQRLTW